MVLKNPQEQSRISPMVTIPLTVQQGLIIRKRATCGSQDARTDRLCALVNYDSFENDVVKHFMAATNACSDDYIVPTDGVPKEHHPHAPGFVVQALFTQSAKITIFRQL